MQQKAELTDVRIINSKPCGSSSVYVKATTASHTGLRSRWMVRYGTTALDKSLLVRSSPRSRAPTSISPALAARSATSAAPLSGFS